jgi:hypothetical protein
MATESIKNEVAEQALRTILTSDSSWRLLNRARGNGETGVDIVAQRENTMYLIEVIGYKSAGPSRSKDFYEVFWRAISRLQVVQEWLETYDASDYRIVIALPSFFLRGMAQRQAQYEEGWRRIGEAFPELEIWYISESELQRQQWSRPCPEGSFH